jgi:archaellum component FlaC
MDMTVVLAAWNVVVTLLLAVCGFVVKEKSTELHRLGVLINRTREEVARDNVTQAEIDKIVAHIDARFDKLNDKIDLMIRENRSALS